MTRRTLARVTAALCAAPAVAACAVEVRCGRIAEGVHGHIGDLGASSVANEGLNANPGRVVTPGGAVLIGSGATCRSARDIHAAIRRVTDQPARCVINTGGQDHRGLGRGHFEVQDADLAAVRSKNRDDLAALRAHMKQPVDLGPTSARR